MNQAANKKVIFVCQVFYPDESATSQIFTNLLSSIEPNVAEVEVLCGFPTDRGAELDRVPRRDVVDNVKVKRCGLRLSGKRNLLARGLVYFSFLTQVSILLFLFGRRRLVVGVSNPPFVIIVLGFISWLAGFEYKYFVHDVYPEGLVALGRLKANGSIARIWTVINKIGYARAQEIVVLGRDMASLLTMRYGLDSNRITVLPNWSVSERSAPLAKEESTYWEQQKAHGSFIVQYSGNMGLWHDLDTFVRAAALLKDIEEIGFVFIGNGIRKVAAMELAADLGLRNVSWYDFVPREDLDHSLACCDVALLSLRDGLSGVAVPSKLYGILASGRPVIAAVPQDSEVAFVLQEEACGYVVPPGSADGVAEAILKLFRDARLLEQLGNRAFSAYQSLYTVGRARNDFRRIIG